MGRVRIPGHGNVDSKRGTYYGNTKKKPFAKMVSALKRTMLSCWPIQETYFTEEKRSFFHSHVRVIDSTTTIFSDKLTYLEKEREGQSPFTT